MIRLVSKIAACLFVYPALLYAANDISIPEDVSNDVIVNKIQIILKNGSGVEGFSLGLIYYNNEKASKCDENFIDTRSIYRSAYHYKDTRLAELLDENVYSSEVEFLDNFILVEKDGRLSIDSNNIKECNGNLYHKWSYREEEYSPSPFLEVDRDILEKIKHEKPYGLADEYLSSKRVFIISYNEKYYDDFIFDSKSEANRSVHQDLYLNIYNRVSNEMRKNNNQGLSDDQLRLRIENAVIAELEKMKNTGIVCLFLPDEW